MRFEPLSHPGTVPVTTDRSETSAQRRIRRATMGTAHANLLSVDVEDYFHVEAFAGRVDPRNWDSYESRVEANTHRMLDLFDEKEVGGTFFFLGWVAERHPGLVREVLARGHEVGCHSYSHRLVFNLTPAMFREDTQRAKDVIEQAGGGAIYGYRAPSFSITSRSMWALEILAETGFTYDSSIFPIRHDIYGMPDAPRFPFRVSTPSGPIVEYPLTTFRFGRYNLPVGGGGYLRILPTWYTRLGFARVSGEGLPLIVYVHPWEIDPEQPRLAGPLRSRLRHYTNLAKMYRRLGDILDRGAFSSYGNSGLAAQAAEMTFGHSHHAS